MEDYDPYEIGALDSLLTEVGQGGPDGSGSTGGFRLNLMRLKLLEERGEFNPDDPKRNNILLNNDDVDKLYKALCGEERKKPK